MHEIPKTPYLLFNNLYKRKNSKIFMGISKEVSDPLNPKEKDIVKELNLNQDPSEHLETKYPSNSIESSKHTLIKHETKTNHTTSHSKQHHINMQHPTNNQNNHLSKQAKLIGTIKTKGATLLKNPFFLTFLIILAIALNLRLKYFGMESIWNDAAVHLWYAIQFTQNPLVMFTKDYILGDYFIFQTITGIVYLFLKDIFLSAKIVALLFSLTGITFAYLLGRELKSKFLGLIFALLLATNHIYWFYSVRPMADVPLAAAVIFLIYAVTKLEKLDKQNPNSTSNSHQNKTQKQTNKQLQSQKNKWAIIASLAAASTVLFKVQAVIILLSFILYFIVFKRKSAFTKRHYQIAWMPIAAFLLIGQLVAKLIFHTKALDRVLTLIFLRRGMPYGFEAFGQLIWSYTWYLVPFTIIGALLIIYYKQKQFIFPAWIFALYYLFFEINVDQTADRYLLPLLPIAIIFAAFAIEEISTIFSSLTIKKLKIPAMILITIFIAMHFHSIGGPLIDGKTYSFTGHPEAGKFLKENMGEDDLLFAGSPRMMRAFVEKEYYDGGHLDSPSYGGEVIWLRGEKYHQDFRRTGVLHNPDAQMNFEIDTNDFSQNYTVWLEIDQWEFTQPPWYWPISQESLIYFESLGFQIQYVVYRDIQTQDGLQESPVIFIMKLEQGGYIGPTYEEEEEEEEKTTEEANT